MPKLNRKKEKKDVRSNLTGKKGKGNMKIIFETKYLTLHESRLKKKINVV